MLISHDLYCTDCEEVVCSVAVEYKRYPDCANCGGKMEVNWEHGHAPSTDIYGSEQYSDATGLYHTSQRSKVKHMREWGFEEAGDRVGGARKEHRLNGTTFSFSQQKNHRTASEGT